MIFNEKLLEPLDDFTKKSIQEKFDELLNHYNYLTSPNTPINIKHDNIYLRKIYSSIELFYLQLQEEYQFIKENDPTCIENQSELLSFFSQTMSSLRSLSEKLNLVPINKPRFWYSQYETMIRFLGVSSTFVLFGTFAFIISIFRYFDIKNTSDYFEYTSEKLKKLIIHIFLLQSGIDLKIENYDNIVNYFSKNFKKHDIFLLTFNHSSNLDGFFVSLMSPIRQVAFGKKELFLCPFFSWLSYSIGGIPIDRKNRERAVRALKYSIEECGVNDKITIAISPEGTRSTTGQLLDFKKGPFYMWEETKAPIVTLLLIGVFDLYPVGSWVNNTGKVTLRYLDPIDESYLKNEYKNELIKRYNRYNIDFSEDNIDNDIANIKFSKDYVSNKLRILMLNGTAKDLNNGYIGDDISSNFKIFSIILNLFVIFITLTLFLKFYFFIKNLFSFSHIFTSLFIIFLILFINFALYYYYLYVDVKKVKVEKKD